MKFLAFITLIFTTSLCLSQKLSPQDEAKLVRVENFSEKNLTAADMPELISILNLVLELDPKDRSRTAVITLSESYNRYPRLYERAFRDVSKNKSEGQRIRLLSAP